MRFRPIGLMVLSLIVTAPVFAKEGVVATLLTVLPNDASEGSQLTLVWSLYVQKSGASFNACDVFVRLVGSGGDSTEALATPCREVEDGQYSALVTVPPGGVSAIEIGIAGSTAPDGRGVQPIAFFSLTNNPFENADAL